MPAAPDQYKGLFVRSESRRRPHLPPCNHPGHPRWMNVGASRLDQSAACRAVARLGDRALAAPRAGGILARDEPEVAHELPGRFKACEITELRRDGAGHTLHAQARLVHRLDVFLKGAQASSHRAGRSSRGRPRFAGVIDGESTMQTNPCENQRRCAERSFRGAVHRCPVVGALINSAVLLSRWIMRGDLTRRKK